MPDRVWGHDENDASAFFAKAIGEPIDRGLIVTLFKPIGEIVDVVNTPDAGNQVRGVLDVAIDFSESAG